MENADEKVPEYSGFSERRSVQLLSDFLVGIVTGFLTPENRRVLTGRILAALAVEPPLVEDTQRFSSIRNLCPICMRGAIQPHSTDDIEIKIVAGIRIYLDDLDLGNE
jgi:hypothetical protein